MFNWIMGLSLHNRTISSWRPRQLLMVYGAITAWRTPVDVFPDLNKPWSPSSAEAGGMAPEEVEATGDLPSGDRAQRRAGVRGFALHLGLACLCSMPSSIGGRTSTATASSWRTPALVREQLPGASRPSWGQCLPSWAKSCSSHCRWQQAMVRPPQRPMQARDARTSYCAKDCCRFRFHRSSPSAAKCASCGWAGHGTHGTVRGDIDADRAGLRGFAGECGRWLHRPQQP